MTNVVDINKQKKTAKTKKRYKRPSKAQMQTVRLIGFVSEISAIMKSDGDACANGNTGEVGLAWWTKKGEVSLWLDMCKHGNITVTVNCMEMSQAQTQRIVGACALNGIEWDMV